MKSLQSPIHLSNAELHRRVTGCWLGKAVGGTLGMPYEGDPGPLDLDFYRPVPTRMLPNDDLDLQVVWACVLDRMPQPRVDRHVLAQAWQDHVGFPWDEYGVAKRNMALGLKPPLTGSYDNWFAHGMGAAIRSELWACLAAGDPKLAAQYAYEDACVDHAGEGIWAEVFLTVLESAAFVESDRERLLNTASAALPEGSQVRQAVTDARHWWAESGQWLEVRSRLHERYATANFTDVTLNLAYIVLGWLAGEGDFGRSICVAVNCGADTDCTGATLGGLLGILDPEGIDAQWLRPIGRELVLSPPITGIDPPATLDGFTDLVIDLRQRLGEPVVETAEEPVSVGHLAVQATLGFFDAKARFAMGGGPAPTMPDTAREVTFPGTIGELPFEAFTANTALLRYRFHLNEPMRVKVMFNTTEDCRAWVDGEYAFGRESGYMRPAFHCGPLHQISKHQLSAGQHELVATIRRPSTPRPVQWVMGVADAGTNFWLADALERAGRESLTTNGRATAGKIR